MEEAYRRVYTRKFSCPKHCRQLVGGVTWRVKFVTILLRASSLRKKLLKKLRGCLDEAVPGNFKSFRADHRVHFCVGQRIDWFCRRPRPHDGNLLESRQLACYFCASFLRVSSLSCSTPESLHDSNKYRKLVAPISCQQYFSLVYAAQCPDLRKKTFACERALSLKNYWATSVPISPRVPYTLVMYSNIQLQLSFGWPLRMLLKSCKPTNIVV